MAIPSFSPKFVNALVHFEVDGTMHEAGEHLLNAAGVPGFEWPGVDPMSLVGKPSRVRAKVQSTERYEFECDALFTCEQSETKFAIGLAFIPSPVVATTLSTIVGREGILPDYVRKFPRIHFNPKAGVMPSRAIMRFFCDKKDVLAVTDVDNISPTGFQVVTEDRRVITIVPGDAARLIVMPRGDFPTAILFAGNVKRIIHTIDPESKNGRWYFGLGISPASPEMRSAFTDLMRLIVLQLKS